MTRDSLGKSPLSIGNIRPTPGIVDQYYNDSTGEGDHGEIDSDGPWKTADGIAVVESPALKEFQVLSATPKAAKTTSDPAPAQGVKVPRWSNTTTGEKFE